MDCKYLVRAKPDTHGDTISFQRHHQWLRHMGIKQYRGGYFRNQDPYKDSPSESFRFARLEDATAFKMMFGG